MPKFTGTVEDALNYLYTLALERVENSYLDLSHQDSIHEAYKVVDEQLYRLKDLEL